MRTLRRTLIAALLFPALMGTALAQHRGGHRAVEGPARAWHGEIGRFHEHDIDRWRGGSWYQGRHEGRFGWWWIVAGTWYFYPWRVDPYPDPYGGLLPVRAELPRPLAAGRSQRFTKSAAALSRFCP